MFYVTFCNSMMSDALTFFPTKKYIRSTILIVVEWEWCCLTNGLLLSSSYFLIINHIFFILPTFVLLTKYILSNTWNRNGIRRKITSSYGNVLVCIFMCPCNGSSVRIRKPSRWISRREVSTFESLQLFPNWSVCFQFLFWPSYTT